MQRFLDLNSLPAQFIRQLDHHSTFKIITPTPQAARALKVPHYSLETLAQQSLAEKHLRVAPVIQEYQLIRAAVSAVVEKSDIEGTVRTLTPALKVILRTGVDLKALTTVSQVRIQQLARIAEAYTNLLRENKMVDPAEVFWQASFLQPQRQSLLVYGYFHPRIDQLHFINTIADTESVMQLPCPDSATFVDNQEAAEWLQQQGWQVQQSEKKSLALGDRLPTAFFQNTSVSPDVKSHIYPHLEAEVRGVLAQVKSLLSQGTPANEIVLVARDDAFYGPTVLDIAQEYNLPVRALYAVPLIATRLGAWVQLLLEVIREKFPFESTAKLLSHPLSSSLPAETWHQARKLHPSNLHNWQSLGVNLSFLDVPRQDTRANWVERLQEILNKFDLRQRAGRWAREIVAFYQLQEGLVNLAKPETERISLENFAQDIINSLALLTVPAQPGRGGVELHTPLSLFGAKFQHVFVLGAAEGILPAPVCDDPVLDFCDRQKLQKQGFNLETAAQIARRETVSFSLLLQTPTQSLTFSYPQILGKEAALPSPYLTQLGLTPVPPPALTVASLPEARRVYLRRSGLTIDSVLHHAIHAWAVESRRESAQPYDEYDGVVGLPLNPATRVFSASQLVALGQCPFKWFAAKVLKLAEVEEAEAELNPGLRGRLYHRSLELALRPVLGMTDVVLSELQQLETAFLQAEQDLQLPVLPNWEARRAEHIHILHRAFLQPDFIQPGAEIVAVETEFTGKWYGLEVTGRIDRIDRTAQGLVLLDYKTSSQPPLGIKDEFGKASVDLQISLYSDLAGTVLFPDEPVVAAFYYSVIQGKKLYKKKPSEETLQAVAEKMKHYLQAGYYAVEPDIDQNVCRFCAYDPVCRKGSRQSRKGGM